MDYYFAPSFEGKKFLCDPYDKGGKLYVRIANSSGGEREIRVYDKPQASWSKTKKANGTEKRVERYNDKYLVFNYPGMEYAYLVGMKEKDGVLGFWHYRKKPGIIYDIHSNITLSPLWGYHGSVDREPLWEYDPEFIREEDVRIEGGYRRLIDDKWWKEEVNRLYRLYDGVEGPYKV